LPVNKQQVLADGNRFLSGQQFLGDSFHWSLRTQVIQSKSLEKWVQLSLNCLHSLILSHKRSRVWNCTLLKYI